MAPTADSLTVGGTALSTRLGAVHSILESGAACNAWASTPTDDTMTIQNWLNGLAAGTIVTIPPGVFCLHNSDLTIPPGIVIDGFGQPIGVVNRGGAPQGGGFVHPPTAHLLVSRGSRLDRIGVWRSLADGFFHINPATAAIEMADVYQWWNEWSIGVSVPPPVFAVNGSIVTDGGGSSLDHIFVEGFHFGVMVGPPATSPTGLSRWGSGQVDIVSFKGDDTICIAAYPMGDMGYLEKSRCEPWYGGALSSNQGAWVRYGACIYLSNSTFNGQHWQCEGWPQALVTEQTTSNVTDVQWEYTPSTSNYPTGASSATVSGGNTGGTTGACTLTLAGGAYNSGQKATFAGTVSGGAIGALTLATAGSYYEFPGVTNVPATGCGFSAITLNVTWAPAAFPTENYGVGVHMINGGAYNYIDRVNVNSDNTNNPSGMPLVFADGIVIDASTIKTNWSNITPDFIPAGGTAFYANGQTALPIINQIAAIPAVGSQVCLNIGGATIAGFGGPYTMCYTVTASDTPWTVAVALDTLCNTQYAAVAHAHITCQLSGTTGVIYTYYPADETVTATITGATVTASVGSTASPGMPGVIDGIDLSSNTVVGGATVGNMIVLGNSLYGSLGWQISNLYWNNNQLPLASNWISWAHSPSHLYLSNIPWSEATTTNLGGTGGTGASVGANSFDNVGNVTTGTNSTGFTLTFTTPFPVAPHCEVWGSPLTSFTASATALTVITPTESNAAYGWRCTLEAHS
ncbi:hypothetical protein [Rhodoblastus sp.]|uniref:hypothetical protein n=1 Tax=Rhodoblastus sp. TaxID=1962975 RepID=UPI003F96BD43